MRGYGYSTRPAEMNQPPENNPPIVNTHTAARDVAAVVEFILQRRGVSKLNLIGWSWGTSIMSTYASLYPSKVEKLVIFSAQWYRDPITVNYTCYRTVNRNQAYDRWIDKYFSYISILIDLEFQLLS